MMCPMPWVARRRDGTGDYSNIVPKPSSLFITESSDVEV
jgi:hypothetical protein